MTSLFNARCSTTLSRTSSPDRSWKSSFQLSAVRRVNLRILLKRFHRLRCYSSENSDGASSRRKRAHIQQMTDMEEFFVVRKGDIVGVYRSLSDCQALAGTTVCDPPVSVYKGCSMPKGTENYLGSQGLKNALYSISSCDLTRELFGTLVACPFEQLSSSRGEVSHQPVLKKLEEDLGSNYGRSCSLEFDGASKGNPGKAGAGAILRYDDGSLICRLSEGLGIATCNFAEYRGFILGLNYAVEKGFTNIKVKGDSKLVCMQIQGLWRVKSENLLTVYKEAEKLKDRFRSFQIMHILRELNFEADAQANLGARLAEGEIMEDFNT